ncbi:hypothetical protein [Salinarimonas sp.]|uniref:hypothetical protein n=1 Tax=Salinarimonas sp. TaxID=2766526 RepID=UPI0032D9880A
MFDAKQKIAAAAVALCLVASPAVAEEIDETTVYDRGERALDFLALDRGSRAVPDPQTTGSIAPRARFTSAPAGPRSEWWTAHEAIRRAAEDH